MRNIIVLAKRELYSYFATPIAYVFLVIFLLAAGIFTFYFGNFFNRGQADLVPFFNSHPWLYLVFIPAVTMRLWAEERKAGTMELLFTLPLKTYEVVIAKFISAWLFTGIALFLSFPLWLVVNYLGTPDNGIILASYIGSFIMAGAFLSIGACLSALTKNQVIAFVITLLAGLAFNLLGYPVMLDQLPNWLPKVLVDAASTFSFITNFDSMAKGLLEVKSLVYFFLVILFWLSCNVIIIEAKKAD